MGWPRRETVSEATGRRVEKMGGIRVRRDYHREEMALAIRKGEHRTFVFHRTRAERLEKQRGELVGADLRQSLVLDVAGMKIRIPLSSKVIARN